MADETPRSRAQIEAELAGARERLANNLQTLVGEVHPKAVAQRGVEDVKFFAASEFNNAKAKAEEQIRDADGNLRMKRLLIVGGAVAGLVALVVVANVASQRRAKRA